MKKLIYIILLSFAASTVAFSQYIRIERTDVDSTRSSFITASYKFGMNIYAEDVAKCNGVAFEMRYNKKEFIKYSRYEKGDFKNVNITVIDDVDYVRVIVNASTGLQAGDKALENPKIVHLEFVVLQSAPDFESDDLDVEFAFLAPIATIFTEEEGISSVFLEANPVVYKVHGFINVWPGDTDNNGIVDYLDYEPINRNMSLGSQTKNMRSFKRKSPSTIWVPQRVLKWDSAMVTYADCDGNADITMQDALIVTYNLNKTHDIEGGIIKELPSDNALAKIAPKQYSSSETNIYTLSLNSDYDILAASGAVKVMNDNEIELVGIENSDVFNNKPFLLEHKASNAIEFAVGSTEGASQGINSGNLVNVVYKNINGSNSEPILEFSELKGITPNGAIVNLSRTTSVESEVESKETIVMQNGNIVYTGSKVARSVRIFDVLGNELVQVRSLVSGSSIPVRSTLQSGLYIAIINIDGNIYRQKFIYSN